MALEPAKRQEAETASEPDQPLSYRTALIGVVAGFAFLLFWCHSGGMHWWVAALLFGLTLSYFFIFTRIRAEARLGLLAGDALSNALWGLMAWLTGTGR